MGVVGEKERAGAGVVKLSSIVALDFLDGGAELGACIGGKIGQGRKSFRFQLQRKRPQKMPTIIKNDYIIFIARALRTGDVHKS
jgi:hypothetical protein